MLGAAGPLFTAECDEIRFRPGADDERTAWPRFQPGPLAAWTGWRSTRIVLPFALDAAPAGWCELRLDVLALQGPLPDLDVEANGVRMRHFLVPERHDRSGLASTSHIAGWARLAVPIAPGLLRAGENRITLATAQEDGAAPEEQGPVHPEYPYFWDSSIQYGSVELRDLGSAEAPPVTARVTPLPLYVREPGGALCELVDVVVAAPLGLAGGDAVTLEVAGRSLHARLDAAGRDGGEFRARLRIPDLDGTPQPAALTVTVRGATRREAVTIAPCRKWTVHLIPHVHLDVGYTDSQAKVTEVHSRNLDRVLAVLRDTPGYRYSVDGSFVVEQFAASRRPEALARVLAELRTGRLSVNAFFVLFLSGIASLEDCYRAAYAVAALRRQHGVPVEYANLTDVPSYSAAIPSMLHALGVDAFMGIENHGRAANEDADAMHLVSPFLWEGPDGARVLTFFADCYAQLRYFCGHPTTVAGAAESLTRLLHRYDRDDYAPSDFPLVGIYSDNEDLGDGEADVVARWQKVYEYPRLRHSTIADYFTAVRPLRGRLPVARGDGGSYWEDGVGSDAALTAALRRTQALLPVAETWAALVSTVDPALRSNTEELDRAWRGALVGSEHTWTWMHGQHQPHSHQAVDQLAWKRHQVDAALRIATDESRRALSQLGELVHTAGPSLLLSNALSWDSCGIAELDAPSRAAYVDAAGETLPIDVVADRGRDLRRVRVRATVPGFGYRAYTLQDTGVDAEPAVWQPCTGTVETARHRLRVDVDRGRITSLHSTSLQRELLDCDGSGLALAEVLYVRRRPPADGGDDSLRDADRSLPPAALDVTPATMRVEGTRRTPWGALLRLRGAAPSLPEVDVEVELYDDDDRVDVRVRLGKEAVIEKESVYVAFPFAVPDARLLYDRQQGWIDPQRDHAPGACNEWFTTQHAVGLDGDGVAVAWCSADAPLFCCGDVVRGRWPRSLERVSGTLLSWPMNNHWWTNYPAQQEGEVELRYAFVATPRWDAAAAARLGRELRTPPLASTVTWLDKMDTAPRPLDARSARLLDLDAPPNLVVTVAEARAADALLLRVQETAGSAAALRLRHPFGRGAAASRCSALEEPVASLQVGEDGDLRVEVAPHEVVSLLLSRR